MFIHKDRGHHVFPEKALDHFLNDAGHFIVGSLTAHWFVKQIEMEATLNTLTVKNRTLANLMAIADEQADNKTIWFFFSLIFQGVLFLPIPAVLLFYYNASIIVLPITFGLYLSNIIVGMGGSNIRVVLGLFIFSILINLIMLALYIF